MIAVGRGLLLQGRSMDYLLEVRERLHHPTRMRFARQVEISPQSFGTERECLLCFEVPHREGKSHLSAVAQGRPTNQRDPPAFPTRSARRRSPLGATPTFLSSCLGHL